MKRAVAALICLILCASLALYNTSVMRFESDNLVRLLDSAMEKYGDDKDEAVESFKKFSDRLKKLETYLGISLDHDEVNLVFEAANKTFSYLKASEEAEFKAEFANLRRLILRLAQLESLSLGNIF